MQRRNPARHTLVPFLAWAMALGASREFAVADPKLLLVNWTKADAYRLKFCKGDNDCPDRQYDGVSFALDAPFVTYNYDCAHFVGHVLNAGGVLVPGSEAKSSCKSGVVKRASEFASWFAMAATKYVNVKQITRWQDTRVRDIAFERRMKEGALMPFHVMMLASTATQNGARVFAHSNDRCGEFEVPFKVEDALFFRIEPSPLDGTWDITDEEMRFSLEISGPDVVWIERRADRSELSRSATLMSQPDGSFRIERENNDEVLRFLDFPDASLRKAILDAKPRNSYILLRLDGASLDAIWHGLAVRKKGAKNDQFDSLIQPGSGDGKHFVFKK